MDIKFEGGVNIALKIPKGKYEQTVSFYRDVLRLEVEERDIEHPTVSRTHRVKFGNNLMWLDCVDNYAHAETWLELNVDDVEQATRHLRAQGIDTCDEIEQIPDDMHWIKDPAGSVFLVKKRG